MYDKPIDWARKYAATMPDARSLRIMRQFASDHILRNAGMRAKIVETGGEKIAANEWDPFADEENTENHEAIRLIDARLAEMGLRP